MALINRQTLKNYFKKGGFATEKHFIDLIDSTLNSVDDGISKTSNEGLKLSSAKENSKLLSFFKNKAQEKADYSVSLNSNGMEGLSFDNSKDESIIKLSKKGNVGVNTGNPKYNLEVNGTLAVKTRLGVYATGFVPADGNWHSIISNLDGICAFEIIAKAEGNIGNGYYSVAHCIALSTFGGKRSKNKIKLTSAYYERYFRRISFRWVGELHNFSLQVRTRANYGISSETKESFKIKYNITNLIAD
ncbi:hypothetical protein [Psychroflexus planctonicus]|nr:hypothetical protein [Psychroflexus planctonicus]